MQFDITVNLVQFKANKTVISLVRLECMNFAGECAAFDWRHLQRYVEPPC